MHKFSDKTEAELQDEVEKAFQYVQGNAQGGMNAQMKVLLVIAERNRRFMESLDRKNQIYTWVIIALSVAAILAQLIPLFTKAS